MNRIISKVCQLSIFFNFFGCFWQSTACHSLYPTIFSKSRHCIQHICNMRIVLHRTFKTVQTSYTAPGFFFFFFWTTLSSAYRVLLAQSRAAHRCSYTCTYICMFMQSPSPLSQLRCDSRHVDGRRRSATAAALVNAFAALGEYTSRDRGTISPIWR